MWIQSLYTTPYEVEHYIDGQHNGGYYNPRNSSVYGYTYQNPIKYVDPNGKQVSAKAIIGFVDAVANKFNNQINRLTNKERTFFKTSSPHRAVQVAIAESKASKIGGWGDKTDAKRHVLFQALNTQNMGEENTREFANAHEYATENNKMLGQDVYMDIHNNDLGIEIGLENPNATTSELLVIIDKRIEAGDALIFGDNRRGLKQSDGSSLKGIRRADDARVIIKAIKSNSSNETKKPQYETN